MSRSFKKTSYCGDNKGKKKKRLANDKVRSYFRRYPDRQISPGDYRKIQNPWDICDYCTKFESFQDYWECEVKWYEQNKDRYHLTKPNKKELYRDWYKAYKMK